MIVALLLLACSSSDVPAAAASSGPPPASVSVASASDGTLSDSWTILGEVAALERAELAAGASGPVAAVHAREGDTVDAGFVLLEVDTSLIGAELAAARAQEARLEAELEQARRTLRRMEQVESGVMAATEVEQAQTSVASLEAQHAAAVAQARLSSAQYARHRIRAPFPGVVSRRHVDTGDWVNSGMLALEFVRTDAVEILVDAPYDLASRVEVGDIAQLPGGTAEVAGVVRALDPVSRTSVIRLEPVGELAGAVPGSALEVVFDVQSSGGVIVPRDAVVAGANTDRVFKVVDGAAVAIDVSVLASTADRMMVRGDGLSASDTLIVRGNERLRPGQAVVVQP